MRALLCVLWSHFGKLCHSRHQSQTHESFPPPQHRADCTLGMNEWKPWSEESWFVAHPFAQNVGSATIKRISGLNVDLENCHSSTASMFWSGDLKQCYVYIWGTVTQLGKIYLPPAELLASKNININISSVAYGKSRLTRQQLQCLYFRNSKHMGISFGSGSAEKLVVNSSAWLIMSHKCLGAGFVQNQK